MPYPTPWLGSPDSAFTKKPFFTDEPRTLMEMGDIPKDVPIMIGTTKHEGLLQSITLYNNREKFEVFRYFWQWYKG